MSAKGTPQKVYTLSEVKLVIDRLTALTKVSKQDINEIALHLGRSFNSVNFVWFYYNIWKKYGRIYRGREYMARDIFSHLSDNLPLKKEESVKEEVGKTLTTDKFSRLDNLFEEFKSRFVEALVELNLDKLNSAYQQGYKKGKEDGEAEYRQKKISTLLQNRLNEGGNNHGS